MSIAQELDSMEKEHDETALGNAFLRADKIFVEKATFMGKRRVVSCHARVVRCARRAG
jgi:hypothetical protein